MIINSTFFEQKSSVIVAVLTVTLCIMFAWQVMALWSDFGQVEIESNTAKQSAFDVDVARIIDRNLFAAASRSGTQQAQRTVNTESRTDFVLQAIFESAEHRNSRAIISAPGNTPRNYTVGSQLGNGIHIDRIERDRVVLNNQGRLEVLKFPSQSSQTQTSSTGSAQVSVPVAATDPTQHKDDKAESSGNQRSGLMKALPNTDKLDQVRRRLEQLRTQSRNQ